MRYFTALLLKTLCLFFIFNTAVVADNSISVPILTYHNFDPTTPGSMTISPAKFESQVKWLKDNGYTVIPLKDLVNYLEGKTQSLPAKPVVITADDGRKSVHTYMWPIVRKYNIPVTLFIYPSAISNASYAMTWNELKELQKTGLFDIQSHTYWHPNFNKEQKSQSPSDYKKFVNTQLAKSKKVLEEKVGTSITLLAWPFGIYNEYVEQQAAQSGYEMAFTIDGKSANRSFKPMAQPRYMIVEPISTEGFAAIVSNKAKHVKAAE